MTTQVFFPIEGTVREVGENEPETGLDAHHVSFPVAADPTPEQMMRAVEASGVLDFWNDPQEDIYSSEDGQPL